MPYPPHDNPPDNLATKIAMVCILSLAPVIILLYPWIALLVYVIIPTAALIGGILYANRQ